MQVGELRDELTRRKADNRGIKKLLVERLFNIMQEEARKLASAKQSAVTDSLPAVKTRAPRRSRRSTDSSAGLQLRRTSQQHDQESPASQIMQSMQSMPAPHARLAAFAVRRTLISKLGMAAKASAVKQQQEQLVAADAVSRSAASAWPPREQSSGDNSHQTLPRASMQSAEAGQKPSQLSAATVDQAAADRRLKTQSTAVQSSETRMSSDQGHHHSPKVLAQQAQQAQHQEHAEVAQRTQPVQHLHRAEEAQRAHQAQLSQQAQHVPQTGLAIQNPLSAGTSGPLPADTSHTDSADTSDPLLTSISGSTADSAQHQHRLTSPGSTATQDQPSRHSVTGQAARESPTLDSATPTLPPHATPHMLSQAEEEDWWEDTGSAAGVDTNAQQRQASSAQPGEDLASRAQASSTPQRQASSTQQRQASNGEASTTYDAGNAWKDTRDVEALNSNVTGLQISFLGTAGRQDCRTRCATLQPNPQAIGLSQSTRLLLQQKNRCNLHVPLTV